MNMMKDQLKRADDRAKAAEKKVDVVFLFSFLFVFQEYFAEYPSSILVSPNLIILFQVRSIEEDLASIGENQKQLEVTEEKARKREEKYQEHIKQLTSR